MEWEKPERRPGSVEAAVSSINEGNLTISKFQTTNPEKPFIKTGELRRAKRDTNQLTESRKIAELVTAEAASQLSVAKKTMKSLTLRIEESNARAKAQMVELEKLRIGKREVEEWNNANFEREKVARELEIMKRDLSRVKMDVASVMEERKQAEKEMNDSMSKRESYLSSAKAINKEIEEISEEHVLVELARIEAIKECEEIDAYRREQAEIHSSEIDVYQKKMQNLIDEIEDAKELEPRLNVTVSDIRLLENELKQIKDTNEGLEEIPISAILLESVLKELEATKKELAQVKDESFKFMASMDIVRDQLRHVKDQTAQAKKVEQKSEKTIQNLNSKLMRAKTKLEAKSAAEDKANSIISNLNLTLEQLESEAETHKKEQSAISGETAIIKEEVQKAETEIDLAEERLQAALQDLKAVKSSEAMALENLKSLVEKTVRNRALASQPSTTITISKIEYEYLKGNAAGAKEIADKKVAAAQAWIEALKASEKEIQIKTELLRRETRELQMEEQHEFNQTNAKKIDENDLEKWSQMTVPEKMPSEIALHSKASTRSIKRTPTRRENGRRSASPVVLGTPRTTSFTVGRRRKVMPNLAKFFSGEIDERDP